MNSETENKGLDGNKKDVVEVEKFLLEEGKYQNDIITLDLATYHKIPQQLHHILTCKKNCCTQFDVLNLFVIYALYEVGFIGDWIGEEEISKLSLNWCYSFDRRIFEYCTPTPSQQQQRQQNDDNQLKLIFKFALDLQRQITFSSLLSGDIALLTVYEIKNPDTMQLALNSKSLAVPISRYIPFKKLCENIPNSFRNLRELSIKLKNELILPIRNEIYHDNGNSPTPYFLGLPECIVIKIFKHLKQKEDVHSLKCVCRRLNDIYKSSIHNKKRKFE